MSPMASTSPMASIDELWLVDFGKPYPGEPASHRPALVLGPPEIFSSRFPLVILAPLTTTNRGLSLHVELPATAATGLRHTSFVQCEMFRAVSTRRLIHKLGSIDPDTSYLVGAIVRTLLNY